MYKLHFIRTIPPSPTSLFLPLPLIGMWAQTVQAVADSRVSMDIFWCLQDTAMFFICLQKSACCHSRQDEMVFPAHLVLANALFPRDFCQWPCFYCCLSHPIVDVRNHTEAGSFKRTSAFQSLSSKQGTQNSTGKLTTSLLLLLYTESAYITCYLFAFSLLF